MGSGTPVVDVRVGAYLILLFVFVAGITEMPNGCIARELEEINYEMSQCQVQTRTSATDTGGGLDVPADDGSTAGFLFRGVALGCGDGEVLTTIGGSPSQRIAMPFERN